MFCESFQYVLWKFQGGFVKVLSTLCEIFKDVLWKPSHLARKHSLYKKHLTSPYVWFLQNLYFIIRLTFFQQDKQEVVEYYIAFGSGEDTIKNVVNMRN